MTSSLRKKIIIFICVAIAIIGFAILIWAQNTGKIHMFADTQTQSVSISTTADWDWYKYYSCVGLFDLPVSSNNNLCNIQDYNWSSPGLYISKAIGSSGNKLTSANIGTEGISLVPGTTKVSFMPATDPNATPPTDPNDSRWIVYYQSGANALGCNNNQCEYQDNPTITQLPSNFPTGPVYMKVEFDGMTTVRVRSVNLNFKPTFTSCGTINLTAKATSSSEIDLSWAAAPTTCNNENFKSYSLVEIYPDTKIPSKTLYSGTDTSFKHIQLDPDTTHYYQVYGTYASEGNFIVSSQASATTQTEQSSNKANMPVGYLDEANCDVIRGWTCDINDYTKALTVHLFDGPDVGPPWTNNILNNIIADQPPVDEPDANGIKAECGGTTAHRFNIPTPDKLKDNKVHQIYAYAINIPSGDNPLLPTSTVDATHLGDHISIICGNEASPIPTSTVTSTPTTTPSPTPTATPIKPNAPVVSAQAINSTSIKLTWNKVENASMYNIYFDGSEIPLNSTAETSYTVSNLTCNQEYSFVVRAVNVATNGSIITTTLSDNSNVAKATTRVCGTGDDISNLTVNNFNITIVDNSTINLSWDAVNGANGYDIYTCDNQQIAVTGDTKLTLSGLKCGTTQCYYVVAHSASGSKSKPSDKKSVTIPACSTSTTTSSIKGPATLVSTGTSFWIDIVIALVIIAGLGYFVFRKEIWKEK